MYKLLDIKNWNRREHFEFFSKFDDPFFGIVAEIDCTNAYRFCKEHQIPFFLFYHYKSIIAVNRTEEFRYRIHDNGIIVYDTIHVTTTISRDDNTFAFSFIPFVQSFGEFSELAQAEIRIVRGTEGLRINENSSRMDVIHYSTVPWISFSGVTHARNFKFSDSIPKITFGKYTQRNEKKIMPVSINVHHGLMDGYHVGQYLELFEQLINDKQI
jgi:chloramphenicol O-acetyltransferase type A